MDENTISLKDVTVTGVRKTNTYISMISITRTSLLVSIGFYNSAFAGWLKGLIPDGQPFLLYTKKVSRIG